MKDVGDMNGPIAVMIAVLVGLCGCFSYGVTKRLMSARDNAQRAVTQKADPYYIESYLEENRGVLTVLANDDSFARLLTAERFSAEFEEARAAANECLARRLKATRKLRKLSVLDIDGTVIASTAEDEVGRKEPNTGVRGGTSEYAWAMEMRAYADSDDLSIIVLLPVRAGGTVVGLVKGNLDAKGDFASK